jgi:AraC-type DNA-binding domain-containing proteins
MDRIFIATYKAPLGKDSAGRIIEANTQDVEIITAGRGYFEREGRLYEAVSGTVLWHLPGERTIYRNDYAHPYECTIVTFPYKKGERRKAPRFSRWKDAAACGRFADEILRYFHGESPDLRLLADYAYQTLLWNAIGGEPSLGEGLQSDAARIARDTIDGRFRERLSIEDIARLAGLSVPHLHAVYREATGESPHRALVNRRLVEARRLLVVTRKSVKEIAYEVGYADPVAFCKAFKKQSGLSPGAYRDKYIQTD